MAVRHFSPNAIRQKVTVLRSAELSLHSKHFATLIGSLVQYGMNKALLDWKKRQTQMQGRATFYIDEQNARRCTTEFSFAPRSESNMATFSLLTRVEVRKLLAKMSNFRRIVVHDVWVVRMECSIVLVIGLGCIESLQRNYLGHDGALEDLGFFELCDIRLGDPLLLVAAIENGRTILGAFVRTLPVQLRGVVGHREEDPKQLAEGDFGRVIDDLHRLRMTGVAGADQYVFRGLGGAPGVSTLR